MSSRVALLLKILIIAVLAATEYSVEYSVAAELPTSPILRIEAGMHTAPIKSIATDAAGRYLVTGSDDKTVRVWELGSGRLLQILRVPIGEDSEGMIYAVAISPDGSTIACGGWTTAGDRLPCIYLFDRATGSLLRVLEGLSELALDLAFSPDGKHLAVVLGRQFGMRVFRASDGAAVATDAEYRGHAYAVAFDRAGRLATVAFDGFARLYDTDFTLLHKQKLRGGQPFSVSFSPDGESIAVGFSDTATVEVLSGDDLSFLFAPDTTGVNNGNLYIASWSADGQFLYAGGLWMKNGKCLIRRWSQSGRGSYNDLDGGAQNSIRDLVPLRSGVIFGSLDPAWACWMGRGSAF